MGLGAGAINRFLNALGVCAVRFHGVEDEILTIVEAQHEAGLDLTAATETPGGAMNFVDENVFKEARRREFFEERGFEDGVTLFFAGADEVAGEKSEGNGVFGGFSFAGFRAWSGAGL